MTGSPTPAPDQAQLLAVMALTICCDSEESLWSGWNAVRDALEAGGPCLQGALQRLGMDTCIFFLRGCLGGATRKGLEFRSLGLRERVAAGRRDHVHPRHSAGDMANSLAISGRRFPYSNGFRMPLLQGIRPKHP